MNSCRIPGCQRHIENRDTGLCATHNKALRKVVQSSLRKTGEKLAKKLSAYSEAKRLFLRGKHCVVYPSLMAQDIHHMAGRSGDMLMDKNWWLPVSRKGHVEIELNPIWAKKMGFSVSRLIKTPLVLKEAMAISSYQIALKVKESPKKRRGIGGLECIEVNEERNPLKYVL